MAGDQAKSLVLLVDDEPIQLEWLCAVLQDEFELEQADCGARALSLVEQGLKPDLVLLDVQLPDFSGHEVLRAIHQIPAVEHVPVIIMSADRSERNEMVGFDLGADDFIAKPIDPRILKLRMRNLLQREQLRRETLRLGVAQAEQALATTQAELRATRTELEEVAKFQALGRLVASFAHDIGNPIGNGLLAITSLQEEVESLNHKLAESQLSRTAMHRFIETSRQGSNLAIRNLELARQMLQAFKRQALDQATVQCRKIELVAWLRETMFVLSPMWRKSGVEVRIDIEGPLPITTLPGPLTQVLSNLVGNAITHAFDDGKVGQVILAGKALPDGSIELRVKDNGKGMSEAVAARALEPFFTTKAGSGGTGLGLDIVKQIVERQLQGELSFTTTLGVGTEFNVRLPAGLPASDAATTELAD